LINAPSGRRLAGNGHDDHITPRCVVSIAADDDRRALLDAGLVGEGKGNQDDVAKAWRPSQKCMDHKGMPFGLQIVGPFRADRALLGAAHALEQAFAAIPALKRPVPDIGKLTKPTPALKSIVTHPPIHRSGNG
jgi:hypothetical protein